MARARKAPMTLRSKPDFTSSFTLAGRENGDKKSKSELSPVELGIKEVGNDPELYPRSYF